MAVKSKKVKKTLSKAKLPTKNKLENLKNTYSHKPDNYPANKSCCMGMCSNCSHCYVCNRSLDDQVRVVFGSVIVILIILGYMMAPFFFFLTGILGAVYIISGITGKCFTKRLLRRIPCNKNKEENSESGSCTF